ncbi:MAG: DUF2953 domain-containing protein [Hydrogenibacillus sp.]|nr:DUF2953 domain-containing protein [Hydrogenibacillus sp.]
MAFGTLASIALFAGVLIIVLWAVWISPVSIHLVLQVDRRWAVTAAVAVTFLYGRVRVTRDLWPSSGKTTRTGGRTADKAGERDRSRSGRTGGDAGRLFRAVLRHRRDFRNIHLTSFRWRSIVGTGDAAESAILSGLAHQVKTFVWVLLASWTTAERVPELTVKPDFRAPNFTTALDCIAHIRLGDAMLTAIKIAYAMRGRREMSWTIIPSRA